MGTGPNDPFPGRNAAGKAREPLLGLLQRLWESRSKDQRVDEVHPRIGLNRNVLNLERRALVLDRQL